MEKIILELEYDKADSRTFKNIKEKNKDADWNRFVLTALQSLDMMCEAKIVLGDFLTFVKNYKNN